MFYTERTHPHLARSSIVQPSVHSGTQTQGEHAPQRATQKLSLGWILAVAVHPTAQEVSPTHVPNSHTKVTFKSLPSSAADALPPSVSLSPGSFMNGTADQK